MELLTAKELHEKMKGFSHNFFLVDIRRYRESYLALNPEELGEYVLCLPGIIMNHVMDGNLKKAWEILNAIPDDPQLIIMKLGIKLVLPQITWEEFSGILNYFRSNKLILSSVVLTVGRPYLLNGFNDFTRLGPFIEKYKDRIIEDLNILYESECTPFIYRLCLAEYYYQKNMLLEAEVLVSQTIKEFDRKSERRLLFVAMFLQSKILLANNKSANTEGFIRSIRDFVKQEGEAEFSQNIEATHVLFSLYEGKYNVAANWFKTDAPDEYGNFSMLDLYRYMVKIRCYIVSKNFTAAIALAEKLRPLLEEGRRHQDLCELNILLTITFYLVDKKDLAFKTLEQALKIARRRKYYRLIADEGEAIIHPLIEYVNEHGPNPFIMEVIDMTRSMAIAHPLYLKAQFSPGESFTKMEVEILRLLEQGKSKEEIGEYFFISENTVKYHLKKIYFKLDAKNANHAVWQAKILGII